MMVKLTKIDEKAWISKITKNKGKGKEDEIDINKDEKKTEKKKIEENSSADEMGDVEGEVIEFCTFIREKEKEFIIDVIFNKKGKYVVGFYAKSENKEKYDGIADFIVYCEKDAEEEKFYPKHYGKILYEIISPDPIHVLEDGKKYNFKIKSKGHQFYVLQSDLEDKETSYFKLKNAE
jgi:hypothetical protein